jgi:hypothetical protein
MFMVQAMFMSGVPELRYRQVGDMDRTETSVGPTDRTGPCRNARWCNARNEGEVR